VRFELVIDVIAFRWFKAKKTVNSSILQKMYLIHLFL